MANIKLLQDAEPGKGDGFNAETTQEETSDGIRVSTFIPRPAVAVPETIINGTPEGCAKYGLEWGGVVRLRKAGLLPIVKIGRGWHFFLSDLKKLARPEPAKVREKTPANDGGDEYLKLVGGTKRGAR